MIAYREVLLVLGVIAIMLLCVALVMRGSHWVSYTSYPENLTINWSVVS